MEKAEKRLTRCDKKREEEKIKQKNFKKDLQLEKECDIISSVTEKTVHRGIAQLVEYRSPKPWVAGSNPPAPAKKRTKQSLRSFFIQSEGLVCNHPQGVWNRRRRMASRASVYLSFGLMPYITS